MMFMALAAAMNKNTTNNNDKKQKNNWNSPKLILHTLRVNTNYEFLSGVLIAYGCIETCWEKNEYFNLLTQSWNPPCRE